jgi:cytochrome c oxidase subunit II
MNFQNTWKWFRCTTKKIGSKCWGIWFLDPPKDISLDGYRIDNVIKYTDGIILFYFSIVVLLMVYFLIKYRFRLGHKAEYIHGNSKKYVIFSMVMGMMVFLTVDVVIEGMAFKDLKEAFWNFPKGPNVVRIEVMPQQFAWNFRYAGEDIEFGTEDDLIPAQNQMHIPVNTPVVIQIAPYDVIHSFFIPNFRVKIDATPGMINTMWFQATETGNFEIACAELCGNSHYRMRGFLTVDSPEDYQKWLTTLEEEGEPEEDDWGDEDDDEGIPTYWGWAWKESI